MDWEHLINAYGFPVILLVIFGVMLNRFLKWLRPKGDVAFDKTMEAVDGHIRLVAKLEGSVGEISQTQRKIGDQQERITQELSRHVDILDGRPCVAKAELERLAEEAKRPLHKEQRESHG